MPNPPRTLIPRMVVSAIAIFMWAADAKAWDKTTVQENHPHGPHGLRTGGSRKRHAAKCFARTHGRRMRAGR